MVNLIFIPIVVDRTLRVLDGLSVAILRLAFANACAKKPPLNSALAKGELSWTYQQYYPPSQRQRILLH